MRRAVAAIITTPPAVLLLRFKSHAGKTAARDLGVIHHATPATPTHPRARGARPRQAEEGQLSAHDPGDHFDTQYGPVQVSVNVEGFGTH